MASEALHHKDSDHHQKRWAVAWGVMIHEYRQQRKRTRARQKAATVRRRQDRAAAGLHTGDWAGVRFGVVTTLKCASSGRNDRGRSVGG